MADVFLSYKKLDRARVEGLARDLEAEGFTVWWDYAIESGDDWFARILEEVRIARCLVGCWTRQSVNAQGMFVPSEADGNNYVRIEHEKAGRQKIAGALLDAGCMPAVYADMQVSDLVGWTPGDRTHSGFRDLVERAEKLATPAFIQRTLAALEARRAEALEQLAAARARGDGLQLELNRRLKETAEAGERFETERRAWEQEKLATGAVLARQQELVKGAEALRAEALTEAVRWRSVAGSIEDERAARDEALRQLKAAATTIEEMKRGEAESLARTKAMQAAFDEVRSGVTRLKAENESLIAERDAARRAASTAPGRSVRPGLGSVLVGLALALTAGAAGGWMWRGAGLGGEEAAAEGAAAPAAATGAVSFRDTLKDGSRGPEMVWLPRGSFMMGSPDGEWEANEHPQRRVTIGYGVAIGRYEVTWDEYNACVNAGGCRPAEDDGFGQGRRPVTNVSWDDAKAYAAWLSGETGERYRLPSEAEWEYAARAGSPGAWPWGSDPNGGCAHANAADMTAKSEDSNWTTSTCTDGVGKRTAEAGRYAASAFGLHDMIGNVWDWVEDCYADNYSAGQAADGSAFTKGSCTNRVLRGGSWYDDPEFLRSAVRIRYAPGIRSRNVGFRLARTL